MPQTATFQHLQCIYTSRHLPNKDKITVVSFIYIEVPLYDNARVLVDIIHDYVSIIATDRGVIKLATVSFTVFGTVS